MRAVALLVLVACTHAAAPIATTPAPAPKPPRPVVVVRELPPSPVKGREAWAGVRFDAGSPLIKRVVRTSPAERGGLLAGDVVVSLDGIPATGASELVAYIKRQPPGSKLVFVITRDGAQLTKTVEVGVRPDIDLLVAAELKDRPAPDFAAQHVAGSYSTKLADLRGQVVIVDFWATWCRPCAVTMPYLDKWQQLYGAKGLRVVGLSSEPVADVTKFLADHWLSYAIGLDAGEQISQEYMVPGMPMLVVIDRTGIVRAVHIGADEIWTIESTIQKLL
ncbi:MAG: redoxin domain-containing protein [Kofleriaceae bacterium]